MAETRPVRFLGLLALALTLTACGSTNSAGASNEPTTSEPETVTVTLAIRDDKPLESFTNAGGGECSSRSFEEALNNAMGGSEDADTTPVTVTLRDADGTIVASEELPQVGGSFGGGSCQFDLDFSDVPASSFYEAQISGYNLHETMTAPSGEAIQFVI